jgi:threonine/homoserine/homoserine lactone efflux protein
MNIYFLAVGFAILILALVVISPYSQFGAYLRRTRRPVVRYSKIIVAIGLALVAIGLALPS